MEWKISARGKHLALNKKGGEIDMFEFIGAPSETQRLNHIIREGAALRVTDVKFIELEIKRFKASARRKAMIDGERYFAGQHDILARQRTVIGENGKLEAVANLPNNRIVNNQYRKMVNQKVNYLLGQQLTFKTENKEYARKLKQIFNKGFSRLIKNVGRDSLNCAVGWVFPHYDASGEFAFKRFKPYEIIPGWQDTEHTELDYAIRLYEVIGYEGDKEQIVEKVEVFEERGIYKFTLEDGRLIADQMPFEPYFTMIDEDGERGFHWLKIPLVPFKFNSEEISLIKNVKALQDGLNLILSNFQNNMEEDARNTILVVVNYDGENLGQFRKNLATYGAVKIKTIDGAAGDVRTLQVEVNADNYKAILEIFKKAIIENAMGYDAKDDRLSGNPNQDRKSVV